MHNTITTIQLTYSFYNIFKIAANQEGDMINSEQHQNHLEGNGTSDGDGRSQIVELDHEQLMHAVCSTDEGFQHVVIEIQQEEGADEADVSMEDE